MPQGYGDGLHFRSATVGGLDLSSHGLGPGFGLAVAAWLLEIAVAVLAFFAEPGPEGGEESVMGRGIATDSSVPALTDAPRASPSPDRTNAAARAAGGPDWLTMGRAKTAPQADPSASVGYGGGSSSGGGCGGCFGRSSAASLPGARGGRLATVENPLRTAALAGMGAGAPRLPPPSAAAGPHDSADAAAWGATAASPFPGARDSRASYDARSEAASSGYPEHRGAAAPPSHAAAPSSSSPRLPPPVLAALGLGDGPGPAAAGGVASLPRPASLGVGGEARGVAVSALQPHDDGGHGSDRAAFDDVEGMTRTHVDETW